MAYDFPANPTPGQEYTPPIGGQTYIWQPPRWLTKGIPPAGGGSSGAGIPEAPIDTKQYARKDADWAEIASSVTWTTLTGKPSTFPPSSHTHPQNEVIGLTAALDGKENFFLTGTTSQFLRGDKTWQSIPATDWSTITSKPTTFAPIAHVHPQSDVTNLVTDLAGKAPTVHTHAQADVTGLVTALAGKEPLISTGTGTQYWRGDKTWQTPPVPDWTTLTGKPATFPPSTHTHVESDVTGLVTDLAAKEPKLPLGGNSLNFLRGDKTWQPLPGNDWTQIVGKPTTFPPDPHTHAQAEIDNLTIDLAARMLRAGDTMTGTLNVLGTNITSWSGLPISTLVGGSTAGGLIESQLSAHLVLGIRDNDTADSVSIVSYNGTGNYSKLVARFRADGTTLFGGLTAGVTPTAGDNSTNFATTAFVQTALIAGVPPGAIMHFARNTPPAGWIKANGAAVSRTTYAALFAAIGTTFGAGDGAATFNVPDLRGEFIRGWDDARGIDASRAFATAQVYGIENHTHPWSSTTNGQSVGHTHGATGLSMGGESVDHTHGFSVSGTTGNDSPDHSHGFSDSSSTTASGSANHSHTPPDTRYTFLTSGAGLGGTGVAITGSSANVGLPAATSSSGAAHTHTVAVSGNTGGASARHAHSFSGSSTTNGRSAGHTHAITGSTAAGSVDHTHSVSGTTNNNTGGIAETRPRNIALLACIKF